jgi:DNA-binding CsgD family transcriptional regulator
VLSKNSDLPLVTSDLARHRLPAAIAAISYPISLASEAGLARHALSRVPEPFSQRSRSAERAQMRAVDQMELLSWIEIAAVLINSAGSVVNVNNEAAALLGSDLQVFNRRLAATDRASNERLQELIRAAFNADARRRRRLYAIVLRQHCRPLLVSLICLQPSEANVADRLAILAIVNTDCRPGPDQTVLRTAFGLTASEARLADHIATGGSLEDAGVRFGITRGTAAKKLKSIFAKTDTHRQAELVSLLARFTF